MIRYVTIFLTFFGTEDTKIHYIYLRITPPFVLLNTLFVQVIYQQFI